MDEKYIESMDAAAAPGMLHLCFSQHADVIIYLFSTISITDVSTYHGMQKEHEWRLDIRAGGQGQDVQCSFYLFHQVLLFIIE